MRSRNGSCRRAGAHALGLATACAVAVMLSAPRSLCAQSTDFVLSTAPITFPTPTIANYQSWPESAPGPVTDSVAVPFAVNRAGNSFIRVTSVLIRCLSVAGGKACSDIEWRNGPAGPWRALTVNDETVESRTVYPLLLNDPWSGTLWLRVRIRWDDPAPSVMTSGIALSLSVYRP